MGDKKRRLGAHAAILATNPLCIYSGAQATTAEHMPPISMFDRRWRPNQMVFSACEVCNRETRLVDMIAAIISRMYPDHPEEAVRREVKKLIEGVGNNLPDALTEMYLPQDHFLKVDGPIVSQAMRAFAAKMGFAMHYQLTGANLPSIGVVRARWYTNVQALSGDFLPEQLRCWNADTTLTQGKQHVAEQFWYRWVKPAHNSLTASLSFFRQSFAVFAIATAKNDLDWTDRPGETWRLGDFHGFSKPL